MRWFVILMLLIMIMLYWLWVSIMFRCWGFIVNFGFGWIVCVFMMIMMMLFFWFWNELIVVGGFMLWLSCLYCCCLNIFLIFLMLDVYGVMIDIWGVICLYVFWIFWLVWMKLKKFRMKFRVIFIWFGFFFELVWGFVWIWVFG